MNYKNMKNNLEVELKFSLKIKPKEFVDFLLDKFKKEILEIQPRTLEQTTMYDSKDRFMETSDGRLRIRRGYKNTLSYKRPITRDGIKVEIEYETEITEPDQVVFILKELGYRKKSGYERFRTIWKVKRSKIFLDEFSFGSYIEIEGEKNEILIIAEKIGLTLEDNITKSYDGIYLDKCKGKNIKPKSFIK